MLDTFVDPYYEGYTLFTKKVSAFDMSNEKDIQLMYALKIASNPYAINSFNFSEWECGWFDASMGLGRE